MTVVPNFLLKRLYQAGSLQNTPQGLHFAFKNMVGPGHITTVNEVVIKDFSYKGKALTLIKGDEMVSTETLSAEAPYKVLLNDVVTIQIEGLTLEPGAYDVVLDVVTHEAGQVRVTVKDSIN